MTYKVKFVDPGKNYRMIQSMSRKGDRWDNAPAESFFETLKSELNGYRAYRSRYEARRAIFEYIEVFYGFRSRYPLKEKAQIPVRFYRIGLRCLNKTIERRTGIGSPRTPGKQPVLTPKDEWPDRVLEVPGQIVVKRIVGR